MMKKMISKWGLIRLAVSRHSTKLYSVYMSVLKKMGGEQELTTKTTNPWVKLTLTMVEKRINGKQLAELTGLNVMSISKLKNGKLQPSMATLEKIADALGVEKKNLL